MSDNWVVQNLENALETWNSKLSEIWQLVTQTPETFKGGDIWNVIVNIHGALQAVGLALLVLFFVLSLIIGSLSAKTTRDAQIGDKLISELEFDAGITSETAVKTLSEAPENINAEDFETFIIGKISDEGVKTELKSYYEKDKSGLYYTLTKDAAKNNKARIVEILNDINYSPEAVTTIVE